MLVHVLSGSLAEDQCTIDVGDLNVHAWIHCHILQVTSCRSVPDCVGPSAFLCWVIRVMGHGSGLEYRSGPEATAPSLLSLSYRRKPSPVHSAAPVHSPVHTDWPAPHSLVTACAFFDSLLFFLDACLLCPARTSSMLSVVVTLSAIWKHR